MSYEKISLDRLVLADYIPRISLPSQKLSELAKNIENAGLLAPIHVRPVDGKYEIFAGQRRYQALRMIGAREAPCIVHHISREKAMKYALAENIMREDLTDIETAQYIKRLLDEGVFSNVREVAEFFGRSDAWVRDLLSLLKKVEDDIEVRRAAIEKKLDLRTVKMIAKLPREERKEALDWAASNPPEVRRKILSQALREGSLQKAIKQVSREERVVEVSGNEHNYTIFIKPEKIVIQQVERGRKTLTGQITIPRGDVRKLIRELERNIE